jgi:AcrR family transcriptional regulator
VGLSKASVLHHAGSVENLVRSAQGYVVSSMLEHVTAAVRAAAPQEGPRVYIETMVRHFRENPHHTRMLTEALTHGHDLGDAGTNEAAGGTSVATGRWQGVATLLAHAREAGCLPERSDLRTPALLIGGGIDAIVGEALRDPDFDDDAAATELADVAEAAWLR